MTEPTQKPVVHKEAGVAGEPCELNGSTVDQIASAFQDGFTNGNMSWKETPEYHKDMYREGVRSAMSALSSAPVPPVSDGKVEPVAWTVEGNLPANVEGFSDYETGIVFDYKNDCWANADVPLYRASPPARHSDEEVERLREALQKIADHPENFHSKDQAYGVGWAFFNVQAIARAALQRDAQGGGE